jgi:RNA polymerase sigma-70 factor (ECF subfamily)
VADSESSQSAVASAFRQEYGRTVAVLLRSFGDLELVEDAVQDAFVAAAATWPTQGVPPNPQAWIVLAARRAALDRVRRAATARRHLTEPHAVAASPIGELDDELRLILLCAHPSLSPESQVALTLRFVGGLTTEEIARVFGVPSATIGQRLSRAKAKIRDARIPLRLPEPERWRDRIDVALAVVYAVYNEGYVATRGGLRRTDLLREGVRLARRLRELAPADPEAAGLLALLLLLQSRDRARVSPGGDIVPLPDQDRSTWDAALITEGHALVRWCLRTGTPGPYQLQAAIQAVHCDAATDAHTDWPQILALYDQLLALYPSAGARTARAFAVSKVEGPAAGLSALEECSTDQYVLAVRADLLAELGRHPDAALAFRAAADLTENTGEREHLERRAAREAQHPIAPR